MIILRARVLAIACCHEDADDLDTLRDDPGFRLALGKLPGSGAGLASQPTMNRWENASTARELARMMIGMMGIYCASYSAPPKAVTMEIDDTCDVVHGYQEMSFWNGRHGERCFLPSHVQDTATGWNWQPAQRRSPPDPSCAAAFTGWLPSSRARWLSGFFCQA